MPGCARSATAGTSAMIVFVPGARQAVSEGFELDFVQETTAGEHRPAFRILSNRSEDTPAEWPGRLE
jgi:hypothetical protein